MFSNSSLVAAMSKLSHGVSPTILGAKCAHPCLAHRNTGEPPPSRHLTLQGISGSKTGLDAHREGLSNRLPQTHVEYLCPPCLPHSIFPLTDSLMAGETQAQAGGLIQVAR